MKVNTKSLLYGTFILTAANFIVRILGFIYRIFLSRMIGAQGMGLVQLIFPVYFITVTLTSSGIPVAVSRIVAQRKAIHDERGIKRTVFLASILVAIIGTAVSLLVVLNANTIAVDILQDVRTKNALLIFFPCILITGIGAILKGYFYGTKNIHPPAFAEIAEQLVRIIFVSGLLLYLSSFSEDTSVIIVILGMVIGELASLLYLHYHYRQSTKNYYRSVQTPSVTSMFRHIGTIAVPVTVTRFIHTLMMSLNAILIPQRLMASGLTNHEAVGLFGIVSGMVMPLLYFPFTLISALSVIIIPNLSENVMLKNWSEILNKISKSIMITCLTAFMCMGLLLPLGHPIGVVLYKQPAVGKYLEILVWSVIFLCLQHSMSSILNGLGQQNRAAVHFMIGGFIQLTCTYFLVASPHFGIMGFIIGFMASSIIVTLLNGISVIQTTGLKIKWLDWIIKPAAASYFMALIIRTVFISLTGNGTSYAFALAASVLVGLIVLMLVLLAIGSLPSWLMKEVKKKVGFIS